MSKHKARYRLRVVKSDKTVFENTFTETVVTIGRAPTCNIVLVSKWVSREHAALRILDDDSICVVDTGSSHGIYWGHERIQERVFEDDFEFSIAKKIRIQVEFCAGTRSDESETAPVLDVSSGWELLTETANNPEMTPETDGKPTAPTAGDSSTLTCPHCWHRFDMNEILAISQHPDLVGDPVLGPEAQQRFVPSRFTPEGHPTDARGVTCQEFACPHCHLSIPRTLTRKPPIFFSIVGAPASGKSYLLTSMVSKLRNQMPAKFGFRFADADPSANAIVNEYEQILFRGPDPEEWVELPKTELQGHLYDEVSLRGMSVWLPRPLMFTISPEPKHPRYNTNAEALTQTIVLYDNAGEHFQPGRANATNPGTQHLIRSKGIFFLYDPTKDARFRKICRSKDPQITDFKVVEAQERLLTEAILRIETHSPHASRQELNRPLIVVVTKFDIWRSLLKPPFHDAWCENPQTGATSLDLDVIRSTSIAIRHILKKVSPELVAAAESFSSHVTYLPTSALGHSPTVKTARALQPDGKHKQVKVLLVQSKSIRPIWSTIPMLYMLTYSNLIPLARRKYQKGVPHATGLQESGSSVTFTPPGTDLRMEAPKSYMGSVLMCPETGKQYWLPSADQGRSMTT